MTNQLKGFQPDWASPPGDTIIDLLQERGWNQIELSKRLGFSTKQLNRLIKGEVPISDEAALRLERVLGSTANFWLNREARYREHLARLNAQKKYQTRTTIFETSFT